MSQDTHAEANPDEVFGFGPFSLFPSRYLLTRGEQPVSIGSRALSILVALVEREGELVSKDELVAHAWPGLWVEEGNLRVQMVALRKVLGKPDQGEYITTTPGLGYQFSAPIRRGRRQSRPPAVVDASVGPFGLPVNLVTPLARDAAIDSVVALLGRHRLVTVAGPGGIGKTTIALTVARRLLDEFGGQVCFVDLGLVSDERAVAVAVATALGVPVASEDAAGAITAFLQGRRMLLVLDCCEHVVDVVAGLSEQMLGVAPDVRILATSRESLRATGERVEHLPPLAAPVSAVDLTAAEAITYPAVQLFVERAAEVSDGFQLTDENAGAVGEICRRLDGIALALELAAVQTPAFGVHGVAARLDQRFQFLTRGRRTALPRQKTLAATIAWSFELLTDPERAALRRLSVFAGGFTTEAASFVIGVDPAAPLIFDLVSKSLLWVDVTHDPPEYRLLETTRQYAREQPPEEGEKDDAARRHARYLAELLEKFDWNLLSSPDHRASLVRRIDDVRAALDWSFRPAGDPSLAAELVLGASRLWIELQLVEECRRRVCQALDIEPIGRRLRMRLLIMSAVAGLLGGASPDDTFPTLTEALDLAVELRDRDHQLEALWGLVFNSLRSSANRRALGYARHFREVALAAPQSQEVHVGDQMIGWSLYSLGELADARRHLESMLASYSAPGVRSHILRFGLDKRATGGSCLANILWLQGHPRQALRAADTAFAEATRVNHSVSQFHVLISACCPIALAARDLATARRWLEALSDVSRRYKPWLAWLDCFRGILALREGDASSARALLERGLAVFPASSSSTLYCELLAELSAALQQLDLLEEADPLLERALDHAISHEVMQVLPDILRRKGELAWARTRDFGQAETLLRQAIEESQRQGALTSQLAGAASLGRILGETGRTAQAIDLLAPLCERWSDEPGLYPMSEARAVLSIVRGSAGG